MKRSMKHVLDLFDTIPKWENPIRIMEQYRIPKNTASELLNLANKNNDIQGRVVWDIGCGTGILAFSACILGAKGVVAIDNDCNVILVAKKFSKTNYIFRNIDFIVNSIEFSAINTKNNDSTVIMNPPFGTQRKGIDLLFLRFAFKIGSSVYSLHKANIDSRRLIITLGRKNGFKATDKLEVVMKIPKTYQCHQKEQYPVQVDIYRFEKVGK